MQLTGNHMQHSTQTCYCLWSWFDLEQLPATSPGYSLIAWPPSVGHLTNLRNIVYGSPAFSEFVYLAENWTWPPLSIFRCYTSQRQCNLLSAEAQVSLPAPCGMASTKPATPSLPNCPLESAHFSSFTWGSQQSSPYPQGSACRPCRRTEKPITHFYREWSSFLRHNLFRGEREQDRADVGRLRALLDNPSKSRNLQGVQSLAPLNEHLEVPIWTKLQQKAD